MWGQSFSLSSLASTIESQLNESVGVGGDTVVVDHKNPKILTPDDEQIRKRVQEGDGDDDYEQDAQGVTLTLTPLRVGSQLQEETRDKDTPSSSSSTPKQPQKEPLSPQPGCSPPPSST